MTRLPRRHKRPHAFFQGIKNIQFFSKAESGAPTAPRRFQGKDVRNVRIFFAHARHQPNLNHRQRIFNLCLDAEAEPIAHQVVSLKNLFDTSQIDGALFKKALHPRQIL